MKKIIYLIGLIILFTILFSCSRPEYAQHVIILKVSESDFDNSFNNLYSHIHKEVKLNNTEFITSLKKQFSLSHQEIADKLNIAVKKGKLVNKKKNEIEYIISILMRYKCKTKDCPEGNRVIEFCKDYFNTLIQNY